ncbi:MAG: very short patch repair endonuclease [Dehalococcoidia bacterium]
MKWMSPSPRSVQARRPASATDRVLDARAARSAIMRSVPSKDTGIERTVRRAVHAAGFRFATHRRDMPGAPDLAFPRYRVVLFVHGCFWHGHGCPRGSRIPRTNTDYWVQKVARNRARDARSTRRLRRQGWSVWTVWECRLASGTARVIRALEAKRSPD